MKRQCGLCYQSVVQQFYGVVEARTAYSLTHSSSAISTCVPSTINIDWRPHFSNDTSAITRRRSFDQNVQSWKRYIQC